MGKVNAPKFKSSNDNGLATLLAYQMAQNKSKGMQSQIGNDAVAVGGTDPGTGTRYETPANVQFKNYTSDDIKTIGTAEGFKKHKDFFIKSMNKDPKRFQQAFSKATIDIPFLTRGKGKGNIGGFPTTFGDELSINLNRSLTDMSDRLLRLRSGAQINQEEYERLTGLFPSFKDLSVPFGEDGLTTFPTIRKSLENLSQELQASKQRAMYGGYYQPDAWGDVEETGSASGQPQPNSIGANIPGQTADQTDPVEAIKMRFKQRNP